MVGQQRRGRLAEQAEGEVAYYTSLARMTLWRRDRARAAELLRRLKGGESYMRIPELLLEVAAETRIPPSLAGLPSQAHTQEGGLRRRAFVLQLEAEAQAYIGDTEQAIAAIRRASDAGLIDVVWLDRCPLFEALRGSPDFPVLRAAVKRRADEILDAYRGL